MFYLTSKELSEKWGISQCRILRLAREGRIEGAKLFGKSWMFPGDAEKPADGRTRQAKAEEPLDTVVEETAPPFRFPFYVNQPENEVSPPLSREEAALRRAQLDYLACRFDAAEKALIRLLGKSENSHIRIAALYLLCFLSANCHAGKKFKEYYSAFVDSFSKEFPYKPEMKLLHPILLVNLTLYANAAQVCDIDSEHTYSPSSIPWIAIVAYYNRCVPKTPEADDALNNTYEIITKEIERHGYYYEAQQLHLLLFTSYLIKAQEKPMLYHLRKALDIAYEHDFIYPIADVVAFYKDIFPRAMKGYPAEFTKKIYRVGEELHQSFAQFMNKFRITELYSSLTTKEHRYVLFAAQGYSSKQVATIMHLSERTVANRYAAIYDKLGIANKQELLKIVQYVIPTRKEEP